MSHKMPGPPIAPFSAHGAWVDGASTSADEDGSVANPYKTIQAAINAYPAPASLEEAVQGWMIYVQPGVYDEALAISSSGRFFIEARGIVILGTLATPRNIVYVPITGAFGQPNALHIKGIRLELGGIVTTAAAGVAPHIELEDSLIGGTIDGSTLTVPAGATMKVVDSTVSSAITYVGDVVLDRASLANLTCYTLISKNSTAVAVTVTTELLR